MPIPKMHANETQPEFMDRCMSDPTMMDEFADRSERAAVCRANILGAKKNMAASTLVAEVFAPGKWNGMSFKIDDLQKMVDSFKKLRDVHRVPLKLGHNDEQQMTDGHPALGWVDDLYIDNGKDGKPKLMARFADIPKVVYEAMKKKLYRNVSIELDIGVTHQKGQFDYVLSGVALLGADIPAVNVLADLTAYMSRSSMASTKRACFTAISNQTEDTTVSDELKAQLAEIREKLEAEQRKNAQLSEQAANFAKQEQERAEAEAKAKVTDARAKFTKMLDDAVKAESILPAQREAFSKVLRLDDDQAVVSLDDSDVQALIDSVGGASAQKFSKDGAQSTTQRNTHDDAGMTLTEKARGIQNQTPGLSFSKALERAMAADSALAKAHISESAEG